MGKKKRNRRERQKRKQERREKKQGAARHKFGQFKVDGIRVENWRLPHADDEDVPYDTFGRDPAPAKPPEVR